MDEVSNFCTGDICQLRSDATATLQDVPSVAQLRDDPPWVGSGLLGNSLPICRGCTAGAGSRLAASLAAAGSKPAAKGQYSVVRHTS